MRQLVYTQPGRVEWQDAPDPQLTDQDAALIAPLAVARCDLDAPMVTRGLFPGPYPVGHEVAGTVVAIGPGVTRHRAGDLVIVPYQISYEAACQASALPAPDSYPVLTWFAVVCGGGSGARRHSLRATGPERRCGWS